MPPIKDSDIANVRNCHASPVAIDHRGNLVRPYAIYTYRKWLFFRWKKRLGTVYAMHCAEARQLVQKAARYYRQLRGCEVFVEA